MPDGVEAVRRLRTSWATRREFILDMVGWTEPTPDPETQRLVRHNPDQHPAHPWLYCSGVRLAGWKGVAIQDAKGALCIEERDGDGSCPDSGEGTGNGWAVYDVMYKRFLYSIKEDDEVTTELDRYVRTDRKWAIENLSIPGQMLQFGSSGDTGQPPGYAIPSGLANKTIPEKITKPFPTVAWTYKWHQVPEPSDSQLSDALGKVNATEFDGFFPAETLLLASAEAQRVIHPSQYDYYDITFQFLYRPTGWNKIMSQQANGNFVKIVRKGDTSKGLYETYEFLDLFLIVP